MIDDDVTTTSHFHQCVPAQKVRYSQLVEADVYLDVVVTLVANVRGECECSILDGEIAFTANDVEVGLWIECVRLLVEDVVLELGSRGSCVWLVERFYEVISEIGHESVGAIGGRDGATVLLDDVEIVTSSLRLWVIGIFGF
ncbi:hypothetical protein [Halospeciosus flavus]|uniref:hypothetical protein n=1 Tax=Halospeciosus flavus TaxID=3032283 RepID=UPI0036D41C23